MIEATAADIPNVEAAKAANSRVIALLRSLESFYVENYAKEFCIKNSEIGVNVIYCFWYFSQPCIFAKYVSNLRTTKGFS
jgi:hypothetical protein